MFLMLCMTFIDAHISLPLSSISSHKNPSMLQKDVKLYDSEEILFSAQVLVGNPPQIFTLAIDTYRSNTWLESADCEDCEEFEHKYKPDKSLTYQNLNHHTSGNTLKFCTFNGNLISDYFTISTFSSIASARIEFTLATKEHNCSILGVDGALTLPNSAIYKPLSFVEMLKDTGEISTAVFALFINNFTLSTKDSYPAPALEIGGFNLTRYSSDPESLFYTSSISSSGIWEFEFDSVKFGGWQGGSSRIQLSSTQRYIIGDLNAYMGFLPYLSLSGFDCKEIHRNFVIKCNKPKNMELPDFKFYVGDNVLVLSRYSIWECEKEICTLMIQFNVAGKWIFGQIFLENYFTIYDYENKRIGFAPAAISHLRDSEENSFGARLFCLVAFLLVNL